MERLSGSSADGLAEIALVDRLRVRKILPELRADANSPAGLAIPLEMQLKNP